MHQLRTYKESNVNLNRAQLLAPLLIFEETCIEAVLITGLDKNAYQL